MPKLFLKGKTMQYILSLLPILACPVGMGLLMWFMMRSHKEPPTRDVDYAPMNTMSESYATSEPYQSVEGTTPLKSGSDPTGKLSLFSILFMCLNWKVVVGLAIVEVIIGIIEPKLLLGAIPLLIVAACPLSMLFMMRGMHREQSSQMLQPSSYSVQVNTSSMGVPADEERVACLKAQLAQVETQQQELANQIAELEVPHALALSETETISSRNQR